jgi:ABC-type branched-subunit amino acid transport system substrate-binding protein
LRYNLAAHFDFGSATSLALAPLAERQGLLLVSSAYDPAVGRGREHVMRFANSTSDYVERLLGDLRKKGAKKLVIVRSENPFFVDFADTFKRNLKADESLVIFEVSDTETDFATLVARIERATPQYDALGVFLFTDQAAQLLRRLHRRGERLVLFGTDAFEEVVSSARMDFHLFERMIFPNSDVSGAFVNRYEVRFSTTAHVTFAAGAFDFANLIADLSSVCLACDSAELRELIEESRPHSGARGVYYFEDTPRSGKHFVSAIVMKEIRGGTISSSVRW